MVVVLKPRHFFLPANSLCVYAAEGGRGALTFSLLLTEVLSPINAVST